jgi:regulator of replication initiation timing
MKTKEQTPIEWFAEQLGITSGTTFLKAKDMEANINWLLDKQIKDLMQEKEFLLNKIEDLTAENEQYQRDLNELTEKLTPATKTFTNTTANQAKDNVKDIIFWGDGNTFKLISKASSKGEGWMKSTKALEISEIGCVIQVTTQQGNNVAEALTFVPGVMIEESYGRDGQVFERKLSKIKK